MKIPGNVKIGGISYTVSYVERLTEPDSTAEIDYDAATIELRKGMNMQRQHRDFLHEVFHAIHDNLGYYKHNEKQIDELAGALYQVIVDNPEMFAG